MPLEDFDEPIGAGKRERPDEDVIGDRKRRGRRADAEADDDDGGEREAASPRERAKDVAHVLFEDVAVHHCRVGEDVSDRAEPERHDAGPRLSVASAPREHGAHFFAVLVPERGGVQTQQPSVHGHQALRGTSPRARAMRTRSASRAASALATAVPSAVMR